MLYARPEHWLRRSAGFRGLRGAQEFKTTFNDSAHNVDGLTGPGWSPTKVKEILTSLHANQYTLEVCDCVPPKVQTNISWGCTPRADGLPRFANAGVPRALCPS